MENNLYTIPDDVPYKISTSETFNNNISFYSNDNKKRVTIDLLTGEIETDFNDYSEAGKFAAEIFWLSFKEGIMNKCTCTICRNRGTM